MAVSSPFDLVFSNTPRIWAMSGFALLKTRLLKPMVLGLSVSADYSKYHNAAYDASSRVSLFKQHAGRFSFFLRYYPKSQEYH